MRFDKVVCAGGSGRLGRYVVDLLADQCDLTVIDLQRSAKDVRFAEVSITDYDALRHVFKGQEAIVHLAAIPNPRTATAEKTLYTNVQGTWAVLEAAEEAGVRRVVVASSDAATGMHYNPKDWGPKYLPVDEQHPLRPIEVYSLSKEVTEVICRSYANRGKLEVIVIRPTHIVFPPEWPELRARGSDLQNYHLWSYVEPEDMALSFLRALELGETAYDCFFISAADTLSERPTLELIQERFGYLPEVRKPKVYEQRPTAAIWDISHAREVLGFEPQSDWRRLVHRELA
ncbi:MAG: NAD-dependent epimerase/dehydratase family protein [Alphaproteobacteria bacterium]